MKWYTANIIPIYILCIFYVLYKSTEVQNTNFAEAY